jgi:type VI secretion system protein ImpI
VNWGLGIRVTNRQDGTCFDRVFSRFPVRIGRNALNDLVVEDGFVSQFHLVLENHSDRLWLRDLGSTNGTQLAGLGRAPANQLVDLAAHGFEFSIVSLDFRTYTAPIETAQQEAGSRRRLGVSRYLEAVDPSLLAPAAALAQTVPLEQQHRETITRYRSMWSDLFRSIHDSLNAMPAAARASALAQLTREFPSLAHEPDFERLRKEYGAAEGGSASSAAAGGSGQIEGVALQGIREIAQELCPNLMVLDSVDEVVRFLERLQQVLEIFLRSFVPLRDGYRQFETDMALRRLGPGSQAPIDVAQNHQELARLLLDWRQPAADGPGRIESTLADLMIHQVALLNGVMTGVRSMLFELSPAELERKAEDPHFNPGGMGIGPYRFKSLWKAYEKAHGDLAGEDGQVFSVLFGKQFAQAYEHYFGRGSVDATRLAGTPMPNNAPADYSMPGNPSGRR